MFNCIILPSVHMSTPLCRNLISTVTFAQKSEALPIEINTIFVYISDINKSGAVHYTHHQNSILCFTLIFTTASGQ